MLLITFHVSQGAVDVSSSAVPEGRGAEIGMRTAVCVPSSVLYTLWSPKSKTKVHAHEHRARHLGRH